MVGDFEYRLAAWHQFRTLVERDESPFTKVINYWNAVPLSSRNVDPYDQSTWPDPWEMIEENSFCEFTKLLAVAYTLQLTKRFANSDLVFKIGVDNRLSRLYYMLLVDDQIIGLDDDKSMYVMEQEPENMHLQKIHTLKKSY